MRAAIVPIVVTYNPDSETLLASLKILLSQAQTIVVVDNGSLFNIDAILHNLGTEKYNRIRLLALMDNYGLGRAYNAGISIARSLNATFILLMDHDSIPESDMLRKLHAAFINLENQEKPVCAVGPRYQDRVTRRLSQFVRINPLRLAQSCCDSGVEYVRTDFLISSGSLISIQSLNQIGGMDEDLFIDHVDTEWCFRAGSKGFEIYGICDAVMLHSLGDRQTRIWWGRWRNIPFHQPFRYYYIFRNSILLWQRPYMPTAWKRVDKLRVLYLLLFFTTFSPNRIANFRMMMKGLRDGFNKRTGKL
jgi:rhamnosyltransferase